MTSPPIECSDITFYISSPEDEVIHANISGKKNCETNFITENDTVNDCNWKQINNNVDYLKYNDSNAECHSIENYSESENEVMANIVNKKREKKNQVENKMEGGGENQECFCEVNDNSQNKLKNSNGHMDVYCQCDGQTLSPCKARHSSPRSSSRVQFKDTIENCKDNYSVEDGLKTEDGSGETLKKSLLSVNGSNGHINGMFHDCATDLENRKTSINRIPEDIQHSDEFSITNIQRLSRNSRYTKRSKRNAIAPIPEEKTSWWKEFSVTHIKASIIYILRVYCV